MKPTLLIMAAGIGSRYGSVKQMDQFGPSGESIIHYSVYDAIKAGFGKVVFIIRKSFENDFKELIGSKFNKQIDIRYVFQEIDALPAGTSYHPERQKPWGTGHAVLLAKNEINEPFVVINGDDFYGAKAFESIANYFQNNTNSNYCMVGYILKNTLSENGYVSRGVCTSDKNSSLLDVTERTKIERIGNGIMFTDENNLQLPLDENTIVSMNFWGFYPSFFNHLENEFNTFIKENAMNVKAEFYLPAVVNRLIKEKKENATVITTDSQWFGVTYKEDKPMVIEKINELVQKNEYPKSLWL